MISANGTMLNLEALCAGGLSAEPTNRDNRNNRSNGSNRANRNSNRGAGGLSPIASPLDFPPTLTSESGPGINSGLGYAEDAY